MHPLKPIIEFCKKGNPVGICSVCSSNELVIESAVEEAAKYKTPLLIESTANQINQYGGYMNMTSVEFRDYVYGIAKKKGFPERNIILGGTTSVLLYGKMKM
jgi:D-tagatose-1,6-bisphosphate aldolase subunit GatZ/KbaZ